MQHNPANPKAIHQKDSKNRNADDKQSNMPADSTAEDPSAGDFDRQASGTPAPKASSQDVNQLDAQGYGRGSQVRNENSGTLSELSMKIQENPNMDYDGQANETHSMRVDDTLDSVDGGSTYRKPTRDEDQEFTSEDFGDAVYDNQGGTLRNPNSFQAMWTRLSEEVQAKWSKLTEEEAMQSQGDINKLASIIQQKYGGRQEEIKQQLQQMLGQTGNANR